MSTRPNGGAEPASPHTGVRISTEWTVVNADTAEPVGIADAVLADDALEEDAERRVWTHGIALHTVHAKLRGDTRSVRGLKPQLRSSIARMNERLATEGTTLMGGGAHPFLDPQRASLWTDSQLFDACHEVFDCRRHGWVNSRTLHIGLPFSGDAEFAALHDAMRLLVPIMPAICAASPFLSGRRAAHLDGRLLASRDRHRRIREVGGRLVPEAIHSEDEYRRRVLKPIEDAMASHDPRGVLDPEWLNSRAVVPRFDRGVMTIREVDSQESPSANLAVAAAIVAVVEALADRRLDNRIPDRGSLLRLATILEDVARDADQAVIEDAAYLRVFGVRRTSIRAGELWEHLLGRFSVARAHESTLSAILSQGPLARRMVDRLGRRRLTRERLADLCLEMAVCAAEDSLYE